MDVKEFKIGLLVKLASVGITPREFVSSLILKRADGIGPMDVADKLLGGFGSAGQSLLGHGLEAGSTGLKTLGTAALLAPAAIGAAAGVATERMESPDPAAAKTIQKAELIGLYRRLAREARNRKDTHDYERVV